VTADTSIKDATSHVSGKFKYSLTDDVSARLKLNTPHHYVLTLASDFKDRFLNTGAKLNKAALKVVLECDEATRTYPTTFHANLQYNNLVGLHTQLLTEKGNNLEVQVDLLAKVYRDIYAGGELIYDDKAKSLILSKYGLFWKVTNSFSSAVEYSKVGDKETVDASFFHAANPNTTVGSTFSYDTKVHKIGVTTALSHTVDENVSLKSRVNNHGDVDLSLKGKLSSSLTAEFSTGCNLSGFFHGKTHNEAYSGVNFKIDL
jgi:hypothetical protein